MTPFPFRENSEFQQTVFKLIRGQIPVLYGELKSGGYLVAFAFPLLCVGLLGGLGHADSPDRDRDPDHDPDQRLYRG